MLKKQLIILGKFYNNYFSYKLFHFRQIYRLPNIFIQYQNGTWLNAPLQLNTQLYQILISVQMQQLTIEVYRLSEAYSYFYSNTLSTSDQDYLQKLVLALYNQQSYYKLKKIISR